MKFLILASFFMSSIPFSLAKKDCTLRLDLSESDKSLVRTLSKKYDLVDLEEQSRFYTTLQGQCSSNSCAFSLGIVEVSDNTLFSSGYGEAVSSWGRDPSRKALKNAIKDLRSCK